MGDELFDADGMCFAAYDPDGKKWVDVGEPVSLSADDVSDEMHAKLLELSGSMSLKLTMPWYLKDQWHKIFTGKLRDTVRSLNRNRSWRGRWHRNGKGRS